MITLNKKKKTQDTVYLSTASNGFLYHPWGIAVYILLEGKKIKYLVS